MDQGELEVLVDEVPPATPEQPDHDSTFTAVNQARRKPPPIEIDRRDYLGNSINS